MSEPSSKSSLVRAKLEARHRFRRLFVAAVCWVPLTSACISEPRAAVSLSMTVASASPADASVYIDEEYIGPLDFVAAHGVRLPEGDHRITVQRDGYFPWDRSVTSDRQPIHLAVDLVKIPD